MKIKLHHILFIACLAASAFTGVSYGQDGGMRDVEMSDTDKDKVDKDKMLYSPGESDTRYVPKATHPNPKDSLQVRPQITTPPVQPSQQPRIKPETTPIKTVDKQSKEEKDDSILSFNFLKYIIEKYKLQDIVD
ncbi:MAG: hypothetical protein ACOYXT_21230 [Bacteroidota bacterium]